MQNIQKTDRNSFTKTRVVPGFCFAKNLPFYRYQTNARGKEKNENCLKYNTQGEIYMEQMALTCVKNMERGRSVKIHTKKSSYFAMVVWRDEESITFATENFAKSTCKYKNYGKSWWILANDPKGEEKMSNFPKTKEEGEGESYRQLCDIEWMSQCDLSVPYGAMTVQIHFSSKEAEEDEVEFCISSWNTEELAELFTTFCKENHSTKVTITDVYIVRVAKTIDELTKMEEEL